jgi:signal transduction histidine kinase
MVPCLRRPDAAWIRPPRARRHRGARPRARQRRVHLHALPRAALPHRHHQGFAATLLHAEGIGTGATDDSAPTIAALTDDERRESLRFVELASDQLLDLVNNLLDLSRISAGRFAVDPRPTPLGALVETTTRQLEAARSTHRILVDVPADLPPALIDPARITQVLRNLLDNAMKYAPSGTTIHVEATLRNDEIAVSVTDEGGGIPPDELPHLFERYHRGRDARTRNVAGAGLGLTISRHLVEAHGGRIGAESPVSGQIAGARLTFTLPRVPVTVIAPTPLLVNASADAD